MSRDLNPRRNWQVLSTLVIAVFASFAGGIWFRWLFSGYVAVETAPQCGVSPADSAGCQANLARCLQTGRKLSTLELLYYLLWFFRN